MPLTTIAGEIQAQPLNDNFSFLNSRIDTFGLFYNVKDAAYGAVGDGITSDTAAILAAVSAAQTAGGGIVFFPKGKYPISATITITANVSFWGAGSDVTNMDTTTALTYSVSALVWSGGASTFISISGVVGGISWKDIVIDGASTATIGVDVDRMRYSTWSNIKIIRCATYCLRLQPIGATAANDNCMHNSFTSLYLERCPIPLYIDGSVAATSNVCHNVFSEVYIDYSGNPGLYMGNSDNNDFIMLRFFRRSGVGYTLDLKATANGNRFYHIEAGDMIARTSSTNAIYGYDRTNGQTAPTLEAGAILTWIEDSLNATLWNLNSPIKYPTNDNSKILLGRTINYTFATTATLSGTGTAILTLANSIASIPVPFNVYPVGLSVSLSQSATSGSFTVSVTDNGVSNWTSSYTYPTGNNTYLTFTQSTDSATVINSGHTLGVKITTAGLLPAPTINAVVDVICAI